MNDKKTPLDLREDNRKRTGWEIPTSAAVAAFIILVTAGIVIGGILPGTIETDRKTEEGHLDSDLDVFLASTLDTVTTEKRTYKNVPVPAAFEIILLEGEIDSKVLHPQIDRLLEFIFTNSSAISITVSPGSGWDISAASYEHHTGEMTDITRTVSREVTVSAGRTIFISIDIQQEVLS
ncbi:MAG: hypothetical protein U9R75_10595 [Candidatus Thermoplasmatota archaeon]|nr:hypothetical protein [Candidatus Thermoplasmatota archaeon]